MTVARFWRENESRYNLIGTKCGNCGGLYFPPRTVCPVCHRKSLGKMEHLKLGGKGEGLSFSIVHDAPSQFELPEALCDAIIGMEEGVRAHGADNRLRAGRCHHRHEGPGHHSQGGGGGTLRHHPLRVQVHA
jgi:uncharacterized OB-fold protein